jgi:formylglycine-generating enzyme required for sulfatase activity
MIDRLIAFLQERELLLSDQAIDAGSEAYPVVYDEDIADALWLASKIGGSSEVVEDKADETGQSQETSSIQVVDSDAVAQELPQPSVPLSMPRGKPAETSTQETPEQGLPIQVQAAPALSDTRGMERALRPLMAKVPSLTRSMLDEQATVNRIAERDIWLPVLKPAPERWFDLELVIEASQFSFIWQDTLAEFQHLLECQGAFRNVRTWTVEGAETGQPRLVARKQVVDPDYVQPSRSPKELVDASGRRLVLFVSDCRSSLWRQGKIHHWLALWSQHGPAAIVQLLPERLWQQSELDVGYPIQVSSLLPGAANRQLQIHELPSRIQIPPEDNLTLPVVTLTANALRQWAYVVAAAGRQRAPGRLFDLTWVNDPERDQTASVIKPDSPEARVELFAATASPLAQRLAGMLAAVPVDLPVVHLIQQELLPEVQPVHIAEVFSSGLIKELEAKSEIPNKSVPYDFVKGVRGLLNESTPLNETLDVIEALSQRIARTLGFEIKSFTALLSPKSDWSPEAKAAILPFAQVTTEVLHRLGGEYAELARIVEHDAQNRSGWIHPPEPEAETDTNYPPFEPFDFIDARFADDEDTTTDQPFPPPLQPIEFIITTIEPEQNPEVAQNLEPFEFTVATLQRRTAQRQRSRKQQKQTAEWEIHRQQQRAYRFIEPLPDDITLEMVAIPAGTFLMGSPEDEPERYDDESPQHEVTIESFFMGRYPITQAQWRVVAALPQVDRELDPDPSNFKGDNRPVEQVSWLDATEYCARLSVYTGREYRLPSEAEWEYACRAGTTTPFHFGETISSELANYGGSTAYADGPEGEDREETTPVDHFEVANTFGLSDMHGNVLEWCQDHWHRNYEGAPTGGSAWLTEDDQANRVFRGGSWVFVPRNCRSAYRDGNVPDNIYDSLGFRVVCSAPRTL